MPHDWAGTCLLGRWRTDHTGLVTLMMFAISWASVNAAVKPIMTTTMLDLRSTGHDILPMNINWTEDMRSSDASGPRRSARIAERQQALPSITSPIAAVEKPAQRMCTTCFVQRTLNAFPEKPCSDQCKHSVNTCRTCTRRWINLQLDVAGFMRVRCPECKESMEKEYVRRHGSEADLRRALAMERRDKAEATPGWRWCLNTACDGGQVCSSPGGDNHETDARTLTCSKCGARACIPCDRPYHKGKTCSEARASHREADAASDKTVLHVAKPCPTCSRPIEKDGGCNEVLCTQCGTNFCWLCGLSDAEMEAREGQHAEGCSMNDAMGDMDELD